MIHAAPAATSAKAETLPRGSVSAWTSRELPAHCRDRGGHVVKETGGMHMRRLVILALTLLSLSACVAGPQFTPQTLEGARCKLDCVDRSWGILGTSYSRCLEA